MGEKATTPGFGATPEDPESLEQPEDEATEHALRLMDEALRRNDAGRRWLVAGEP